MSTNKKAQAAPIDWPLAGLVAVGAVLAVYAAPLCDSPSKLCGEWASGKTAPFGNSVPGSFDKFYQFYLTQHENESCRRLHFVGTSLVVLNVIFDVSAGIAVLTASLFGLAAFALTRSLDNGLVEALVFLSTLFLVHYRLAKSHLKPLLLLVLGYGFAWVGHFYFEHNRPATFIYPVYSLASDLKLWADILTRARPF